jgi:hypothetical protein
MSCNNTIFLLVLLSINILPQEIDSVDYMESIFEEIASDTENDEETFLSNYIDELLQNPININSADIRRLMILPVLSSSDAQKIIDHRKKYGPFFSKSELFLIRNIPENKIKIILPFIIIDERHKSDYFSELFSDYKINFRSRYRKKDLADNSNKYSWSSYNRIKADLNKKISLCIITEKDEGEKNITDLHAGYVRINDLYPSLSITAGDFYIENGQGLLLWSSYGLPKSADINSAYKRGRGIVPKSGSSEVSYFRGTAIEYGYKNFFFKGFYSGIHRDAVTDSAGITKLLKDGYHRTELELSRQNSVFEQSIGGSLSYSAENAETEITVFTTNFSKAYYGSNSLNGISLSTKFLFEDILVFGEAAAISGTSAILAGITISPVKMIEYTTLFRLYEPDYKNLYGFGFGERYGLTKNERGVFSGITLHTDIAVFSCYLDQYIFFNSAVYNHNTFYGNDILFHAMIPVSKGINMNFRYKIEKKDNLKSSEELRVVEKITKQNIRGDINYTLSRFRLKVRGDYIFLSTKDKGYMFFNEIKYNIIKELSLILRLAVFSTTSFQSAIYLYESGLPGLIENRVLSGEGVRLYTVVKINFKNFPTLYVKYSNLIKSGSDYYFNSSVQVQAEMKIN